MQRILQNCNTEMCKTATSEQGILKKDVKNVSNAWRKCSGKLAWILLNK